MFGSFRSSAGVAATNPESSRYSPGRLIAFTDPRTQWWLVMIRPFCDTNAAEQPGMRSAAMRARANQAESALNPYVVEKYSDGVYSNVHILPRSKRPGVTAVWAGSAEAARAARARARMRRMRSRSMRPRLHDAAMLHSNFRRARAPYGRVQSAITAQTPSAERHSNGADITSGYASTARTRSGRAVASSATIPSIARTPFT